MSREPLDSVPDLDPDEPSDEPLFADRFAAPCVGCGLPRLSLDLDLCPTCETNP